MGESWVGSSLLGLCQFVYSVINQIEQKEGFGSGMGGGLPLKILNPDFFGWGWVRA